MEPRALRRLLDPVVKRVMMMVARGVIQAVQDEKRQLVQMSGLAGETLDQVERFQEYGFTSHPLPGAEAVAVFVGGGRSHGLVIAVDDTRYKLILEPGEVALYDDLGQKVVLKRTGVEVASKGTLDATADGDIRVESTTKITLEAPAIDIATAAMDVQIGNGTFNMEACPNGTITIKSKNGSVNVNDGC